MLPMQLSLLAHRNQQLFSDHYLNDILPTRPDWAALVEQSRPVMAKIAAIVRAYRRDTAVASNLRPTT